MRALFDDETNNVGDGLDRPAEIEYTNGRVKTRPYIIYPTTNQYNRHVVPRNRRLATGGW